MRAECAEGPRPCPWVSCRHHLGLRVTALGEVRITFPDDDGGVDIEGMKDTCSLDVAERDGPMDTNEIGEVMGISPNRVAVIAERAMRKLGKLISKETVE